MSDSGSGWFSRKGASASRSKESKAKKPRARRSGIMALEPRMMYDGAGHHTATHQYHDGAGDHGHMFAAENKLAQTPNVQTANVQAPPPPSITSVVAQPVNGGAVELQGTGKAGETIKLYADGNTTTVVGTGKVGANGTFDITTSATFADGAHSFTATETGKYHTSAASNPLTVAVDPNAPVITAVVGQSVNSGTVDLRGTGEAGETIDLYADGGTIVGTGTVGAGGTFDITTSVSFAAGVNTFTATESDKHGTSAASNPFAVAVDPNTPAIPAAAAQPLNSGVVELYVTGGTFTSDANGTTTTTVVGTGTASSDVMSDFPTMTTFAGGFMTITDAAVQAAWSPALTVSVEPSAPTITAAVGQPANGGTVELQGTGTAGETIKLYADGNTTTVVGTGTVGANGTFDITTSATFAEGAHTFTATEANQANLTSAASNPLTVNVDPNAPVITTVMTQPVTGGTAELQGTGEAGDIVNIYADGGTTVVGTGTVGANGTFDITTSASFASGAHSFTATEANAANLTSAASSAANVAANVATWARNPNEIVFIDQQVPDYQALVAGVNPGTEVVLVGLNSDGLQQIAGFLSSNPDPNLTTIDILGHGQAGELTLGSADLTAANLATDAQALATIGQALAPGGEIALYACDVAQGATGQQFIADLAADAGGVRVAASTQNIGTLQGTNATFENWSLDVSSTGPLDTSTPFTAAALASYQGLLGVTVAGSSITTTLTVDADGDGGISPGDTVTSQITITDTSAAATGTTLSVTPTGLTAVANSVEITSIAVNDTYSTVGNTPLTVNAANGLLANDIEFNGGGLTFGSFASGVTGGTVSVNSDGSFTFTPTVGFSGVASFSYVAHDAAGNSDQAATVTINVSAPTWYVSTTGSDTTGTGTSANPFATIEKAVSTAAADAAGGNGANNTISVAAGTTYSGSGITLASGEKLIGAGSGSTTFTVSSGADVTLNSGNTISGITIKETGSGAGIVDDGSTIGTLTMSDIAVTTSSGTGISLDHGGTVDITGTTNSINSTSGTALDIENTNIGSPGITFKSISSGAGANDGIILSNTGASGGLTVTGDGSTASSGGTIAGKTGTTGGTTNGIGIYLNNTIDVSIAYMQLDNLSYDGIYGQSVTNFSMDHTVVNGANGSAVGEGSVIFGSGQYTGQTVQNGVTGVASITNSTISGGYYDNLDVFNYSGLLNITLNNDTFGDNNTTHGNHNVYIDPDGIAVINATVTNSHWTGVASGSNFYFDVNSSSPTGSNLSFTGNTVADNLGGAGGDGGSGIFEAIASSVSGSTSTFDIENNAFSGANGSAVIICNDEAGSSTTATLNLTFSGNTIGAAATDGSGSAGGIGLWVEFNGGTMNAMVANNNIYEFATNGIEFQGGLATTGNEAGTLNATVIHNTIEDPSTSAASKGALQVGIYVEPGPNDGGAITNSYAFNLTIGGSVTSEQNTISVPQAAINAFNADDIELTQDGDTHSPFAINLTAETATAGVLSAYSGPGNDSGSQVETFLGNNNSTPGNTGGYFALAVTGSGYGGASPSATAPTTGPTFGTPTILGTDTEGSTLSASALGTSNTYQWQEAFSNGEWIDISGANSSSFTLTEAQVGAALRVVETSVYSDGLIDTVASVATATVADHLTVTPPSISGTDTVGQILTASTPTVDNSDATLSYQWELNSGSGFVAISGATGQTFRLVAADVGDTVEVVVTAADPHGGDVTATSGSTATIAAFTAQNSSSVAIGTLPVGDAVTVTWKATVNAQSDQLIANPTYADSISGSNFATVNGNSTVTLDSLTLGGEIFNDANNSGLLVAGDSGISGVSVSVFAQGGITALETTTTNASGDYDFTGLAAGNYFVQVDASNFSSGGVLANYANSSSGRDATPNDYLGNRSYGLALSGGVVRTNAITIAYDAPHPSGATTFPGDDTTNTLDVGMVQNPVVAGAGNTADFYQGGAAAAVDSGLTVTDPAGANITGATVTIGAGFASGDTLTFNAGSNTETFTDGSKITATQSGGVLTLTTTSGNATAADYQKALDSVTYSFAGDPTASGTDRTRTLSYQVTDANSASNVAVVSTLDVFALPIVAVGSSAAPIVTSTSGAVTADSNVSVTDYNGTTITGATVTISAGAQAGDTLSINGLASGTINNGVNGTITYSFSGSTLTLSGTDTVADYTAALKLVTFDAVTPNGGTRTLTWTASDLAGGKTNSSTPVTTNVDVVFGPVVNVGAPSVTFAGGSATAVTLDSGITVNDSESTTLTQATVTIATGLQPGDLLSFNNGSNSETFTDGDKITAGYGGGVLTLNGTATIADYQLALSQVQFGFNSAAGGGTAVDPTANGTDLSRGITWQVTDGTNPSNSATTTLNVTHTAPTATASGTVAYETGASAIALDGAATVSDPDSGNDLTGATVKIAAGLAGGDVLAATTTGAIMASYDALSGTLTLSGKDTVANYQQVLDSITFLTTSTTSGNRTIDWTVTDGSASNGSSGTATSTVNVALGPQVTAGGTVSFTGGSTAAVTLDPTLSLTDQASATLQGATVTIASAQAGDVLSFNNGANTETFGDGDKITATYAGGVLSLMGTASVADYQTALQQVQFGFNGSVNGGTDVDPTAGGTDTTRAIGWAVSDATVTSNTGTSTLNVVHTGPTVTAGGTVNFEHGSTTPVTLDAAATVSDPDSGGNLNSATVSIGAGFVAGDVLMINGSTSGSLDGLKISYSFVGSTLTLTGTDSLAAYQAALDAVTFSTTDTGATTRTISWTVTDTSNATSAAATSAVDLEPGPSVIAGSVQTFTEGNGAVTLDNSLAVMDPASTTLTGATVTIGNLFSGDTLNFTNQNNITGTYSGGVLTLSGVDTVADYETALRSVSYGSTAADPSNGGADQSRTISWTVSDGVGSSTPTTSRVNVLGVNQAPTATVPTAAYSATEGVGLDLKNPGLSVNDVDNDGSVETATLSVGEGILNVTAGNSGATVTNTGTSTVTISGTITQIDALLNASNLGASTIGYLDNSTHPGTSTALTLSIDDDGHTGTGGAKTTSATATIDIKAVNSAPVLSPGAPATVTFVTNETPPVALFSNETVSDPNLPANFDGGGLTVAIGTNAQAGDKIVLLGNSPFTDNGGTLMEGSIVIGTDSGLGTSSVSITFNSAVTTTVANELVQAFGFEATGTPADTADARTVQLTFNDGGNTGTGGPLSDSVSQTVDVAAPAANTPVLTVNETTKAATEQGAAVTLLSSDTITDSLGTLVGATVQITGGTFSSNESSASDDHLGFAATNVTGTLINGTSITFSYNSATETLTLSGSDSLANYQTALAEVQYNTTGHNPTNYGADPSRTLTWTVNDGTSSNQPAVTTTINVTAVNDAPVATTPAADYSASADVALSLKNNGLSVSDVDGGTTGQIETATLSVGEGALTVTAGTSGAGVSGSGTSSVTISGTTAEIDALLNTDASSTVSYIDTNANPAASTTLTLSINDNGNTGTGGAQIATATSTIDIHAAPVVTTSGSTVTYDQGGSAVTVDQPGAGTGISITDAGTPLQSAIVSVGNFQSGDVLGFASSDLSVTNKVVIDNGTTTTNITESYNNATGQLTLTGSDSLADYQAALAEVQFSSTATTPSTLPRTVTFTVNDGTLSSNSASDTVDVVDQPVVMAGAVVTFDGGGSPVTLDSGLTLNDRSSATLTGATVTIAGAISGDTLSFNNGTNAETFTDGAIITANFNGSALVLSTSQGTASVADYQAALRSVTYGFDPANGDPTGAGRTIDWTVSSGALSSATATSVLNTVHEAPVLTAGTPSVTFNGGAAAVVLDSGITLSDVDSGGNLTGATVTIAPANLLAGDVLSFDNGAASEAFGGDTINASYLGGVLTLSGTATVADYQVALRQVQFGFTAGGDPTNGGSDTSRSISWQVTDGSTSNGTSNTGVTALSLVHEAPVVTVGTPSVTFDGGGSAVVLDSGITVSDVDSGNSLSSATVTIAGFVSGDTLSFTNNGTEGDITTATSATGRLTLTSAGAATLAEWNTALESITYSFSPSNGDPTAGGGDTSRSISWQVTDSSTSNGTSNTGVTALSVAHVAPSVTAGLDVGYAVGGSAVALDASLAVNVVDSAGDLTSATVSIGPGFSAGDMLNFTNGSGITGNYDSSTGVLTLSSASPLAYTTYQTALESITFSTTNATIGARTIDWQVNDGSSSNGLSALATSTVTVSVAPTVTAGATETFDGGGSPVTLDPSFAITQGSSPTLAGATVTIDGPGFVTGVDTLGFTTNALVTGINEATTDHYTLTFADSTSITAIYDPTSGKLALSGTDSVADYQAALQAVTYGAGDGDPTNGGGDTSRTIAWSVTDSALTSNTASSTLNTVHVAPTVTPSGATAAYSVGTAAVVVDSGLTPSDPDSGEILTKATVTIGSGFISGDDVLAFNNGSASETFGGDTITAGYSNGILTLTGTATVADYKMALDSVTFITSATSAGSRTIDWTISDASSTSVQATSTVDVVLGPRITSVVGQPLNGGTVELQGTGGTVGDTINLYADGNMSTIVGTGKVLAGGTFDITTNTNMPFADGIHTFTATETVGGNTATSPGFTVDVDPTAPVISAVVGQPVNNGHVTLEVTGEAGERVNLYADGNTGAIIGSDVIGSGGTVDITTTATYAEGVHSFTATETDSAPLTSAMSSPAFSVNVDPNSPVITTLVGQPLNGGTVDLQGTGQAGDTVDIFADGNTLAIVGSGVVDGTGHFDITTTATFADGVHTFSAAETNLATSLTSPVSTPAFTVDVDPSAPAITAVVGQPVNGGTVDLQGTGEVGETINLYADGGTTIVGTGTVGAGGTFDITTAATFADGVHTFTAKEVDTANLTSTASTPAFTVDVNPNAPAITALVGGQRVNGDTVELQGTGEAGETVNLYADGGTTIVGTGTVGAGGTFDITTTPTFADGVHTFTAKEVDVASLTSAASAPAFTVDVNPSAPAITAVVGQPVNGGTVELRGTGEAGETVNLYADGGTTIVGSGIVDGTGHFDITTTASFADGAHSFTAAETDAAGLTSVATPAFPAAVEAVAPTGLAQKGTTINGGTIEITGIGDAVGDTITIYDGTTAVGSGKVGANGAFDIVTSVLFADGTYQLTAVNTSVDTTETSAASSPLTVNVDPNAPVIKAVGGTPANGGTIELKGTGEVGDTVNLYADGTTTVVGTGTVKPDGTFDITTTATFTGLHTFTATETDNAKLTSAASSPGFPVNLALPLHMFTDNSANFSPPNITLASLVVDTPRGPLLPSGDGFGTDGSGFTFNMVHTDPVLTTASDANVQINLALASLEAPLGGDVVYVEARQADGKPLPDWLKFNPATGTFAGLPPDNALASLAPDQSSDNNIVTGNLKQDFDGKSGRHAPGSSSITIEVLARDSKGNVAVTVFTIDLQPQKAGQHGWNMRPFGVERHASLETLSPELAAIEAAVRDVTRPVEPFAIHDLLVRHGEPISVGGHETAPVGRAGLTEQLASIGWRSMAAQRNALLASLQQGR
jgi:trimeric autotransporter adhesin